MRGAALSGPCPAFFPQGRQRLLHVLGQRRLHGQRLVRGRMGKRDAAGMQRLPVEKAKILLSGPEWADVG